MRTTGSVMPKNTNRCVPMNIEPASNRMLLMATRPASTLRSPSVQAAVRPRKIGALPIGVQDRKQSGIDQQESVGEIVHGENYSGRFQRGPRPAAGPAMALS